MAWNGLRWWYLRSWIKARVWNFHFSLNGRREVKSGFAQLLQASYQWLGSAGDRFNSWSRRSDSHRVPATCSTATTFDFSRFKNGRSFIYKLRHASCLRRQLSPLPRALGSTVEEHFEQRSPVDQLVKSCFSEEIYLNMMVRWCTKLLIYMFIHQDQSYRTNKLWT